MDCADKYDFSFDIHCLIDKMRDVGLFIHDQRAGRVYPNRMWESWGYTDEDMKDFGFIDLVHPEDLKVVQLQLDHLHVDDSAFKSVLFRIRTKSGEWRWIHSTSLIVQRDDQGAVASYVGFDYDLTDEIHARMQAEKSARELRTIHSVGQIISSRLDLNRTIEAILEQAAQVFDFNSASVQILVEEELIILGGMGFQRGEDSIRGIRFPIPGNNPNTRVIQTRSSVVINEKLADSYPRFREIANRDTRHWLGVPLIFADEVLGMITFDRCDEGPFTSDDRRLAELYATQVSIALNNSQQYEELKQRSITDSLTHAFTRRWMQELLSEQLPLSRRHGYPLSVVMFDIDDFKNVNDQNGHLFGDEVLKQVVFSVRDVLRQGDSLCRYGGEEFLAILPHSSESEAADVGERMRKAVEKNPEAGVTVSLGCAELEHSDGTDSSSLIFRADQALLASKAMGKNRVCRFTLLPLEKE
ncbi:sensor domain-containing diguanylate cyclase [Salinispira pacifica]|uniref:diguanylate cyclase n=1 Tax=Salinispira pacifica TaxID=1307761 RepID=V5WJY3_9SPIO|nr:diguanylate cyclase [Salinispira pacifica]AHC16043.1 hypothetical protein L21SP2_2691 [Salinispira pacifica]